MITKHTFGLNIPPQQNHEKNDIKEPIRTHASQSVSDDKTLQKSNLGLMEKNQSAKGKYERWPGVGYCLIKSSAERLWEGPASNNNASRRCANSTVYKVNVKQIVRSKLRMSN